MVQEVSRTGGVSLRTTRCPVRIDDELLTSSLGAPRLGENTEQIKEEFGLGAQAMGTQKEAR
jgi:crotonobetainyl-CoA:carnitine CoA-transferase CaiB-like acyl-CoA transferase